MKSFFNWMENEESAALSEPQHKKGEANMALDKIVERRLRSMIMDLESSGKGTQAEILKSVTNYAEKMGSGRTEREVQAQPAQQSQEMPQAQQQGVQPPAQA